MEKQIKNTYPILKLLSEDSVKTLNRFLDPYINKRGVNNNKNKKKIYTKRKYINRVSI